ncbi:unnamed protein product [Ectocarpus sp. 12 AP-2014]
MVAGGECPICQCLLPGEERGILRCNHVFCFKCIHKWTKTESACPVCRVKVRSITKTLSLREIEQFNVRTPRDPNQVRTKAQMKRARAKRFKCRKPIPFTVTKAVRVKLRTQTKEMNRLLADAPHPQADMGPADAESVRNLRVVPFGGHAQVPVEEARSAAAAAGSTSTSGLPGARSSATAATGGGAAGGVARR